MLIGSAAVSFVYISNYFFTSYTERYLGETISALEQKSEEYNFLAKQPYKQGTLVGDGNFRASPDLYYSLLAEATQHEAKILKSNTEFWRKARHNPLKTINMLGHELIYRDEDLY